MPAEKSNIAARGKGNDGLADSDADASEPSSPTVEVTVEEEELERTSYPMVEITEEEAAALDSDWILPSETNDSSVEGKERSSGLARVGPGLRGAGGGPVVPVESSLPRVSQLPAKLNAAASGSEGNGAGGSFNKRQGTSKGTGSPNGFDELRLSDFPMHQPRQELSLESDADAQASKSQASKSQMVKPQATLPSSTSGSVVSARLVGSSSADVIGDAVSSLESAHRQVREELESLVHAASDALFRSEQVAKSSHSIVEVMRSERQRRLVEAAKRVHSENEVAVLTDERDQLRDEVAGMRRDLERADRILAKREFELIEQRNQRLAEQREKLVEEHAERIHEIEARHAEQLQSLEAEHAAEIRTKEAELEAEHEQLRVQSEDRRRLYEELDTMVQKLEEETKRAGELEARAGEQEQALSSERDRAGELEARAAEQEQALSSERDRATELEARAGELEQARSSERDRARELEARVGELERELSDATNEKQRLQVEVEASRRATQVNVAEQKRLRNELEAQRRAADEASQNQEYLQELLDAAERRSGERAAKGDGLAVEQEELRAAHEALTAERDELRAAHDAVVAERDELTAAQRQVEEERNQLREEHQQMVEDLQKDRRALETALVEREFVDAEAAEWKGRAENEGAARVRLEERLRELVETRKSLEAELEKLKGAGRPPSEPEGASPVHHGLALPPDDATRDELVEQLLQAKHQIDQLLQERAQARLKLRQLEGQATKD